MASPSAKTLLLQTEGAVSQYESMSESVDTLNRTEATALESHINDLITRTSQALNAFVLFLSSRSHPFNASYS